MIYPNAFKINIIIIVNHLIIVEMESLVASLQ
jgi:hypothetical protein